MTGRLPTRQSTSRFGLNVDRTVQAHDALPWANRRAAANPERILVCGSRDWPSYDAIRARLNLIPYPATIVHGAARGADRMAATAALSLGHAQEPHPADWQRHGKRAGFVRNVEMLDSDVGLVIAFQRNGSKGTQHTIDEARRRGIPVEVHTEEGS